MTASKPAQVTDADGDICEYREADGRVEAWVNGRLQGPVSQLRYNAGSGRLSDNYGGFIIPTRERERFLAALSVLVSHTNVQMDSDSPTSAAMVAGTCDTLSRKHAYVQVEHSFINQYMLAKCACICTWTQTCMLELDVCREQNWYVQVGAVISLGRRTVTAMI